MRRLVNYTPSWAVVALLVSGAAFAQTPLPPADLIPVESFFRNEDIGDAKLSRFTDADIRSFYWVNDDRLVFDLIDFQRGGGGQRTAPGLYSVRPDGTEQRQLIKLFGDRFVTEARGIGREPLHWNHVLLHVPDGTGNGVIVGELKADGVATSSRSTRCAST